MMFPFADTESDDITEEEYVPKEYGIDFKTGQLSGKIVEGVDALMVWCWIALHTPRYRVKVVGAEEETVNINTEITFESGYAYEDIKEYINQAVEEYFLEVREKWEKNDNLVVRILQVERAIVDVTGVEDVAGTTLNGAAKNYTVGKNKLPVKGELTCTSK